MQVKIVIDTASRNGYDEISATGMAEFVDSRGAAQEVEFVYSGGAGVDVTQRPRKPRPSGRGERAVVGVEWWDRRGWRRPVPVRL